VTHRCALLTSRHGRLVRRRSEKAKSTRHSTQTTHTAACWIGASARPLRPKAAARIARKKNSSPEVSIFFSGYRKSALGCAKCMPHAETPVGQAWCPCRARASLPDTERQPARRPARTQARGVAAAAIRRRARAAEALSGAFRLRRIHRLGDGPRRLEELRLQRPRARRVPHPRTKDGPGD